MGYYSSNHFESNHFASNHFSGADEDQAGGGDGTRLQRRKNRRLRIQIIEEDEFLMKILPLMMEEQNGPS